MAHYFLVSVVVNYELLRGEKIEPKQSSYFSTILPLAELKPLTQSVILDLSAMALTAFMEKNQITQDHFASCNPVLLGISYLGCMSNEEFNDLPEDSKEDKNESN